MNSEFIIKTIFKFLNDLQTKKLSKGKVIRQF